MGHDHIPPDTEMVFPGSVEFEEMQRRHVKILEALDGLDFNAAMAVLGRSLQDGVTTLAAANIPEHRIRGTITAWAQAHLEEGLDRAPERAADVRRVQAPQAPAAPAPLACNGCGRQSRDLTETQRPCGRDGCRGFMLPSSL